MYLKWLDNMVWVTNDKGVRFINICADCGLIVGGSWFPTKKSTSILGLPSDGVTKSEIDHLLIRKWHRRCLEDVRPFSGANSFSDHQLVIARFNLKLQSIVKYKRTLRTFDVQKLKDKSFDKTIVYISPIILSSLVCEERTTSAGETWTKIVENMQSVAEETLGFAKKKRKQWISDSSWKLMSVRKS